MTKGFNQFILFIQTYMYSIFAFIRFGLTLSYDALLSYFEADVFFAIVSIAARVAIHFNTYIEYRVMKLFRRSYQYYSSLLHFHRLKIYYKFVTSKKVIECHLKNYKTKKTRVVEKTRRLTSVIVINTSDNVDLVRKWKTATAYAST